jgi:4'-phosphopantetheinyl transferase
MFKICYAEFPEPMEDSKFKLYLEQLPAVIKNHILKYRKWQDQYTALFGKLLVVRGFRDLGIQVHLSDLKYNPYGKPYFENQSEFNLTHSGTLVACAMVDQGKIGLDVEEIEDEDYRLFKESFTSEEWMTIEKADDPLRQFYTTWTIKEAATKAVGMGLSQPLKSILIIDSSSISIGWENWYYRKVDCSSQYIMHIASDRPIEQVDLIKIEF